MDPENVETQEQTDFDNHDQDDTQIDEEILIANSGRLRMPMDLIPKPSCGGCESTVELFGSACKHLTLCLICGKSLAEKRSKCCECGAPVTHLIREYNVGASSSSDKNYFIGRFTSRLPNFKKKNENKRSLQKEALQGRQVTDTLRDDEDEDEGAEEGALTKWKELKKLGLNDSDSEEDDDDTDSTEVDSSSPLKPTTSPAGRGTPSTSKPSKAKRKRKEPKTPPNGAPVKKVKTENEVTGPVTEDEIRAVLQKKPVKTLELVAIFKSRLQLKEVPMGILQNNGRTFYSRILSCSAKRCS